MLTHNQKGAVAPLVAIMLVLIVVCVALVVDLGHIHNVKVELQRAVDAAALAGAGQLSGKSGAGVKAIDVAVATAAANTVDRDPVNIDPAAIANPNFNGFEIKMVQPIRWDPNITAPNGSAKSTAARITPLSTAQYDTANGLWVTAEMEVDHIFFFFTDNTPVTADAIAVATPEVPVLPLAIITCVPTEELMKNPGALPDMTVCGIASYSFDPDIEDSAAWTSLTFGANASDIAEFMEPGEGRDKFNQAIFGTGLDNTDGLENEDVDAVPSPFNPAYKGCPVVFPNELNITCGLGRQVDGKDLAAPGEFPVPSPLPNLTQDAAGIYLPNPPFDPLIAYGNNDGALPRWYNLNGAVSGFDSNDHFTRVWTQDGILLRGNDGGTPESISAYIARLTTLAECPAGDMSCRPYGDDRFLEGNLIVKPSGAFAQNLKDALGDAPAYWPDFLAVVKHAGYPKVGVINGDAATVLSAFVGNEMVTDGTNLKCSDNEPFPVGEKTLRVNAPVIFAGACESWKAISNASDPNNGFRYIGLAKTLITRVWVQNNESYDCGDDSEVVQLYGGAACSASDFDPGLRSGIYFNLPVPVSASLKGVEGLTLVPVADDEEDQGSLLKVFLVE